MEKEQNLVEFGERLKQIRLALKLNQAQMAKSINVSNTAISEIENGKYKPGYDFFMSLVKIHRVNFNHLMFGEGKMFLEPETVPDTGPMKMPPESNEEEFFLYHFKRSAVVRHQMLADFCRFRLRDRELIEMDLEERKKRETT